MVEKEVQQHSQGIDNDTEDVRPSPLERSVFVERPRDRRTEDSEGDGREQDEGIYRTAQGVGDQLAEDDMEGELAGGCEAVDGVCSLWFSIKPENSSSIPLQHLRSTC
jgi:hypothetical protein